MSYVILVGENDHRYHSGLNIFKKEFDDDKKNNFLNSGFYFTTVDKVFDVDCFSLYNKYIIEVFLPENNPNFKFVKIHETDIYRSNMLVIGEKYELCSINTIIKFNLKPHPNLLSNVVHFGNTDVIEVIEYLDTIKGNTDKFIYNYWMFDDIIGRGYYKLLNWFKKNNYEITYTNNGIEVAAENGNLNVLNWLINNNYKVVFNDSWVCDHVASSGNTNVYEWLNYNKYAIDNSQLAYIYASKEGHLNVIEWLNKYGNKLKYPNDVYIEASKKNYTHILDWLKNNNFYPDENVPTPIDFASKYGNLETLIWFQESGLKFVYTKYTFSWAVEHNRIDVLEWFEKNGYNIIYSQDVVAAARTCKNVGILKWLKKNNYYDTIYFHKSIHTKKINNIDMLDVYDEFDVIEDSEVQDPDEYNFEY